MAYGDTLGGYRRMFCRRFYLYDLPLEAVLYAALLSATLLPDRPRRVFSALSSAQETFGAGVPDYGGRGQSAEPRNQIDEDYNRLISAVLRDRAARMSEAAAYRSDMTEYYTTWGHQIKTPLAAMRLLLQNDLQEEGVSPERALELLGENFRKSFRKRNNMWTWHGISASGFGQQRFCL